MIAKLKLISSRTNVEVVMNIDREIAERVMGWELSTTGSGLWLDNTKMRAKEVVAWSPSTNIQHDYEVLKHCRDTWDDEKLSKLSMELDEIFTKRMDDIWKDERDLYAESIPLLYEPGDYSLAALEAI